MGDFDTLVSIIVPVYNSAKYLVECMESLIGQTYRNVEIIVINDGSTDESVDIIQHYCKEDCRVALIEKENEGVAAARNVGLARSRGMYVMFVDADDWIASNCVEQAVRYLRKYDLDLILGGTVKSYYKTKEICTIDTSEEILIYENGMEEYIKKVLSNGKVENSPLNSCFTSGPVCKVIKKNVIGATRFPDDLVIGEDTVFNLDVIKKVYRLGVVPELWYYYRMHDGSVTKRYNAKIQDYTERLIKLLLERFGNDAELRPYLCERAIQQFYGMLLLGALNKGAGLNFRHKVKYVRYVVKKDLWQMVFNLCSVKDLPSGKLDKILLYLCIRRWHCLVVLYVKSRNLVKCIMNRRK